MGCVKVRKFFDSLREKRGESSERRCCGVVILDLAKVQMQVTSVVSVG